MFDEVGAGVLIVVLNRFEKRLERDVVVNQRLLIGDDLVLLYVSAKTEHVRDARHSAELQLDDPILNCAQLLVALSVADDLIEINLPGAGGDRAHLRLESRRDTVFRGRETFKDLLPGKVDVRVVAEVNDDDRQTEF